MVSQISHYRVLHPLGEGGMGEVYAGFDDTLHRRVALKAIRAEHRLSAFAKARFLREARILSQLDHPNVCRVYDFIEAKDSDWLVLELIEGKTLHQALQSAIEPTARMAIAEQLAGVLVATHRAGVVHRDLKPANVMLTKGDVVKVLDFGLAQSGETEVQPVAGSPPEPLDGAFETQAYAMTYAAALSIADAGSQPGAITGTPAYMSPEQARGEPATPASDMYALGLILQEVFGGGRAYPPGLDMPALLDHVRRGATQPATNMSSDLAALIARLKSPSPGDRPSAAEASARLRWIREKPKRRLRAAGIALLLLATAGGGVKYAVDLSRERTIALAARDEAERRRGQAEDLIGFMLGDLRKQLEPLGRLDLLDGVGAQAMGYFAAVPAEALSDEELLRRSTALYQIGEVRIAQGNLPAAAQPLEESLALAQALVARAPHDGERLFGLGQSHYWVGFVHWRRHELDAAQRQFEAYLDVSRRLIALDPNRADWQREIAYATSNLGSVLQSRGELDAALERFRECLEVERSLFARMPEDKDLARSIATSHNAVGVVLLLRGRLSEALESFTAERAILEQLVAESPANTRVQLRLMVTRSFLGDLFAARGQVEDARRHYADALRISSDLSARDPTNRVWSRDRARNLFKMGTLLGRDRPRQGLPYLSQAVFALKALTDADPTHAGWQRDLAEAVHGRGLALVESGDLDAGAMDADAALRIGAMLLGSAAENRHAARISSLAHALNARVWQRRGDSSRARAAWEQSLAAISPVAKDSDEYQFLEPLALALLWTGQRDLAAEVIRKLEGMGFHSPRLSEATAASGRTAPSLRPAS